MGLIRVKKNASNMVDVPSLLLLLLVKLDRIVVLHIGKHFQNCDIFPFGSFNRCLILNAFIYLYFRCVLDYNGPFPSLGDCVDSNECAKPPPPPGPRDLCCLCPGSVCVCVCVCVCVFAGALTFFVL